MENNVRVFRWWTLLLPILGMTGCSSPPPADQFKPISDEKKANVTQFLESKQSRLHDYKATVTEEPNIDKRGEYTHVGLIEFKYGVTKPDGEAKWQVLNTAVAEYHFSTKEKKWVYKGCSLKQGGGLMEPTEGLLVTFPEVKAAFEK